MKDEINTKEISKIELENQFILDFSKKRKAFMIEPEIADILGVCAAIMFNQIKYRSEWDENKDIHEGRKWITKTHTQWNKEITFYSLSAIKRALLELEERGLIITKNFNKNRHIRTLSYTINYPITKLNYALVQNETITVHAGLSYENSSDPRNSSLCQNELMESVKMNSSIVSKRDDGECQNETITSEDLLNNLLEDNNKDVVIVPLEISEQEKRDEVIQTLLWHGLTADYVNECENRSVNYLIEKINYVHKRKDGKCAGYLRLAIDNDWREGEFKSAGSGPEKKIYTWAENSEWYLAQDEIMRQKIHKRVCQEFMIFEHMFKNDSEGKMKGDNLVFHSTFKDVMRIIGRSYQS